MVRNFLGKAVPELKLRSFSGYFRRCPFSKCFFQSWELWVVSVSPKFCQSCCSRVGSGACVSLRVSILPCRIKSHENLALFPLFFVLRVSDIIGLKVPPQPKPGLGLLCVGLSAVTPHPPEDHFWMSSAPQHPPVLTGPAAVSKTSSEQKKNRSPAINPPIFSSNFPSQCWVLLWHTGEV